MSLEELPNEILINIARYLQTDGESLVSLACTSRHCQANAETLTFRSISVSYSQASDLLRYLNHGRFNVLREILYDIRIQAEEFAIVDDEKCRQTCRVSKEAVEQAEAVAGKATREVLSCLDSFAKRMSNHPGVTLILRGCEPVSCYLAEEPDIEEPESRPMKRAWLRWAEETLPGGMYVPLVKKVGIYHDFAPCLSWPTMFFDLFCRFTQLQQFRYRVYDIERRDFVGRKKWREALGASLRSLPPSLQCVELEYYSEIQGKNQLLDSLVLSNKSLGYDVLSHELGALAKRLVKLEIDHATLNLVDFFDMPGDWPHLEVLQFTQHQMDCADGTWYFGLDPRVTRDDWIEDNSDPDAHTLDDMRLYMHEDDLPAAVDVPLMFFRTAMTPQRFSELYITIANAVRRMPELGDLTLEFDVQGQTYFGSADHEFCLTRDEKSRLIKAEWVIEPPIEIESTVLQAWKDVGIMHQKEVDIKISRVNN